MDDPVNHPKHYTSHPSGVECIEVTRHMNFNLGNVVKYLWRAGLKNEATLEDLRKAAWYLNDEIRRLSGETPEREPKPVPTDDPYAESRVADTFLPQRSIKKGINAADVANYLHSIMVRNSPTEAMLNIGFREEDLGWMAHCGSVTVQAQTLTAVLEGLKGEST